MKNGSDWIVHGTQQSQASSQFNSQDYEGLPPASPNVRGGGGQGGINGGGAMFGAGGGGGGGALGGQLVDAEVWGTTVNVQQAADVFR